MRSFLMFLCVLSGVSLGGRAYAEGPSFRAYPRGPCERYTQCTRSCYSIPRPTYYYDPRHPGAPWCNGNAETLAWLISTAPGIIVSTALPPLGVAGRAAWFFERALRAGVSTSINASIRVSAGSSECTRCMDSCVDSLIACNNQPVSNGTACGTFRPATAGTPLIGAGYSPGSSASVTQTRHCSGSTSLCCENNSIIAIRSGTAFCYSASAASGLTCAPRPAVRTSSSASGSGLTETAAVPRTSTVGEDVHF